jgi:outer membrane PBP1 activator LpoA protein
VYATSNIYRGIADKRDRDLDGILLVETPWLLGANPQVRAAISAGGIGSNSYTRLNALGADAYLLQTHFSALQAGEDMLIRGNTGLLTLDPQLHIKRELQSATFDGGVLIAQ